MSFGLFPPQAMCRRMPLTESIFLFWVRFVAFVSLVCGVVIVVVCFVAVVYHLYISA
jgi:hypothetical protein